MRKVQQLHKNLSVSIPVVGRKQRDEDDPSTPPPTPYGTPHPSGAMFRDNMENRETKTTQPHLRPL